jgi:hypothetical protein
MTGIGDQTLQVQSQIVRDDYETVTPIGQPMTLNARFVDNIGTSGQSLVLGGNGSTIHQFDVFGQAGATTSEAKYNVNINATARPIPGTTFANVSGLLDFGTQLNPLTGSITATDQRSLQMPGAHYQLSGGLNELDNAVSFGSAANGVRTSLAGGTVTFTPNGYESSNGLVKIEDRDSVKWANVQTVPGEFSIVDFNGKLRTVSTYDSQQNSWNTVTGNATGMMAVTTFKEDYGVGLTQTGRDERQVDGLDLRNTSRVYSDLEGSVVVRNQDVGLRIVGAEGLSLPWQAALPGEMSNGQRTETVHTEIIDVTTVPLGGKVMQSTVTTPNSSIAMWLSQGNDGTFAIDTQKAMTAPNLIVHNVEGLALATMAIDPAAKRAMADLESRPNYDDSSMLQLSELASH